jgi:hypothetical protein
MQAEVKPANMLFSKDIYSTMQTPKSRYSASVKHARVRVLNC